MKTSIKKYQYELILAGALFLSLVYIASLDFIGSYATVLGLLVSVIGGGALGFCLYRCFYVNRETKPIKQNNYF